ncbi:DNA damage-binding protein 1 [Tanacetum coccineum]
MLYSMSHPRGVLYLGNKKEKMMMRADEIHKFSDGTLNKVYEELKVLLRDNILGFGNEGMKRLARCGQKDKKGKIDLEKITKTRRYWFDDKRITIGVLDYVSLTACGFLMESKTGLVEKAKEACRSKNYYLAKSYVDEAVLRVLGVERTATQDEIERAHKFLRNLVHPDKSQGFFLAEEVYRLVERAKDTLLESRADYDHEIAAASRPSKPPEETKQPQSVAQFFYKAPEKSTHFSEVSVFSNNSPPPSPVVNHDSSPAPSRRFTYESHHQKSSKPSQTINSQHKHRSASDRRYKATSDIKNYPFKPSGSHHYSPYSKLSPTILSSKPSPPILSSKPSQITNSEHKHPSATVSDRRYKGDQLHI